MPHGRWNEGGEDTGPEGATPERVIQVENMVQVMDQEGKHFFVNRLLPSGCIVMDSWSASFSLSQLIYCCTLKTSSVFHWATYFSSVCAHVYSAVGEQERSLHMCVSRTVALILFVLKQLNKYLDTMGRKSCRMCNLI